jgi:hypothetical protein
MEIYVNHETVKGVVSFPYKGFTISIQNQAGYEDLVIFGDGEYKHLQLGEYQASAEGIKEAMAVIDHFVLNETIKEN